MDVNAEHLRQSIQALAQPPDIQLQLFPGFVVVADELALEFDNWYGAALSHLAPTAVQRAALAALVAAFDDVGWDDEALRAHPSWQRVRRLARAVLVAFEWPDALPPDVGPGYVPG